MTRISIYSQKCEYRGCKEHRGVEAYLSQIRAAAGFSKNHSADLLVLPGHSLGNVGVEGGTPDGREQYIKTGLQKIQKIADEYEITILGEVGDTHWFRPHQQLSEPMKQTLFEGKHRDTEPELVKEFQDALNSGNRSFKLNNVAFQILLCGEQNILKVPNTFVPEFPESFRWLWDYKILLNPTHDSMGQWNRVGKRFPEFSKDNRISIHVANNLNKSWGTAIRVYHNGEKILDGNFDKNTDLQHHIEDHWRMVTIEV